VDCIASQGALQKVEDAIRSLNADAVIHHTERCHIDLGLILNRGLFNPDSSSNKTEHSGLPPDVPHAQNTGRANQSEAQSTTANSMADSHKHDSRIRTVRLVVPGNLDLERCQARYSTSKLQCLNATEKFLLHGLH
jgi:G3E family GTPase